MQTRKALDTSSAVMVPALNPVHAPYACDITHTLEAWVMRFSTARQNRRR